MTGEQMLPGMPLPAPRPGDPMCRSTVDGLFRPDIPTHAIFIDNQYACDAIGPRTAATVINVVKAARDMQREAIERYGR